MTSSFTEHIHMTTVYGRIDHVKHGALLTVRRRYADQGDCVDGITAYDKLGGLGYVYTVGFSKQREGHAATAAAARQSLVLSSPNGTNWTVTVDGEGELHTARTPLPPPPPPPV